jgi:hypothetical protein
MTPTELIAELRELGPQDTAVIFSFLADRVLEADLANGKMLLDVTDFEAWLRELAEAARLRLGENPRAMAERRRGPYQRRM